jgi:prepilin-type N-terminal cleavage/methylation domain-containing protein/prepilin-type processing-associated H-X9-DG protein
MGKQKRGGIMNEKKGFTLIELLVVIAIIAVLMAILMPALSRVREQGKRIVCEHNLKSLTLAWIMYADENDEKIVNGAGGFHYTKSGMTNNGSGTGIIERAWVGKGWGNNWNNSNVADSGMTNEQKKQAIREGALWSVCNDVDAYKCPTGRPGEFVTYAIVDAMNGLHRSGTTVSGGHHPFAVGKRIGKTTLWIKRRTEIVSPAPAKRMVYIDEGAMTPDSFATNYTPGGWWDDPPIRHGDGTTVSWADGHSGHLKWRASDTVEIGRRNQDWYGGGNKNPTSAEGIAELRQFQKYVWGKNG